MPNPLIWPIGSVTDNFAAVGIASAIIMAENLRRADADFINTSANWIYLGKGHDAIVGSGEALAPRGGSYHIGTNNLFTGDIYAIASAADSNLSMSEGDIP